ncbi:MAG TPA: hypothetical protein VGK48_02965 [Terriglobia bacterium]
MAIFNIAVLPIIIIVFGGFVCFFRPPRAVRTISFGAFAALAFVYGYTYWTDHFGPLLPVGQDTVVSELIIGVIAGIVSALLVWVFTVFFKDSLLPRFEQLVYRGIDISGEWFLQPDTRRDSKYGELAQSQDLRIDQHGHKLSGTAHLSPMSGNKLEPRTLDLTAEIADRLVSGTLHYKDHSRIGLIAFLGQVEGDGRKISGQMVFFDIADSEITADPFVWVKRSDKNYGLIAE